MKILYAATRLNVGGVTRHVAWLQAGVQAAGHECHLVAGSIPPGEDDMSYFVREHGIEPVIIPEMSRELSLKDVLAVWKFYRLLRRLQPDIVDIHLTKAGTVGRTAGLFYRYLTPGTLVGMPRRCRFLYTYHGHVYQNFFGPFKSRLFLWIEKTLARLNTERLIVVSPLQFRQVHEDYGVGRADQFAIIGYGIDMKQFAGWESRRHLLRDEVGAADSDILVGLAGRLATIKNPSLFLRAAHLFKERHGRTFSRRVRFLLIGDGHLRADLERETRELELADDVIFTGQRNDMENLYPGLDIIAMSSLAEGMSLALLEGMANKCAAISTAAGGVPDLLGESLETVNEDGRNYKTCERGILTEMDDLEGYYAGLTRLIMDDELRREVSERGFTYVHQNYSEDRLVRDALNLYHELMQEEGAEIARRSTGTAA